MSTTTPNNNWEAARHGPGGRVWCAGTDALDGVYLVFEPALGLWVAYVVPSGGTPRHTAAPAGYSLEDAQRWAAEHLADPTPRRASGTIPTGTGGPRGTVGFGA